MSQTHFSSARALDSEASRKDGDDARATPARIMGLSGLPASGKAVLLALTRLRGGELTMVTPNGERLVFGEGAAKAALHVHDYRLLKRVMKKGDIGFAESYVEGEWSAPDLAATLTLLASNAEQIMRYFTGGWVGRFINFVRHATRANSRAGARRNILAHYDLGNTFFQQWLDPSMTYSSARFDLGAETLEQGQRHKYRAIADKLELQPGQSVLEIGCGWGGFAEVAAGEYAANITGITISDAQLDYARARMARDGLAEKADIRRVDYRDMEGRYDAIVSIEMFEAVGEKYWPAYFAKVRDLLKPGGRAVLQIITIRDDLFDAYRRHADFIQHYIFPGGMLPSLERLRTETTNAGLTWRGHEAFGQSYAETLAEWARRFSGKWEKIKTLGFDERFKRLWLLYLGYCEAGFRTQRTDVIQLELARPA
jgi:cyclopropane-fatty-acyl-phospholipid synthase